MELDPLLVGIVAVALGAFIAGTVLHWFRQPHAIGYIIIGVILGSTGFVQNNDLLTQFANLGIVLLMFFIGTKVSLPKLLKKWKIAVVGTLLQIILTVIVIWIFGSYFNWPFSKVLLFSFVVSLSSTAIVLKLLSDWNELHTKVGQNVLGILLVQDIALIPMLLVLDFVSAGKLNPYSLIPQIIGGVLIVLLLVRIAKKKATHLPIVKKYARDGEMQVFAALLVCFGFALFSGLLGLSTAIGAFIAGIYVGSSKETKWIRKSLDSMHIVLVALFFVYIGLLIDIGFIRENILTILLIVISVLILNTILNAGILLWLRVSLPESIYAGALLSQIGEFSFLLMTIGFNLGLIVEQGYHLMLATIAITLLITPFWIQFIKKVGHLTDNYTFESWL